MKFTRGQAQAAFALLVAIGIAVWFVLNTEWVDVDVPPQLRGPAKTDPLYAFKAYTKALGVELQTPDNLDRLPPAGATLVLNSSFWDMFPERATALRRWVEDGGHLVVPGFEYKSENLEWTSITTAVPPSRSRAKAAQRAASGASTFDDDDEDDDSVDGENHADAPARTQSSDDDAGRPSGPRPAPGTTPEATPPTTPRAGPQARVGIFPNRGAEKCPVLKEPPGVPPAYAEPRSYTSCAGSFATLESPKRALWAVDNNRGHVMLRVALGKGTVTAANTRLAIYGTSLLTNDDALLLAAAIRLERGQQLWLVTDEKRTPLLELLWRNGAPVILLGVLALVLALWRTGVRFGPAIAAPPSARRSVSEQISGTAEFIAHHGGLPLHRAQLRALDLCARSRVPGYDALIVGERAAVLAPLVGIDTHTLARAMNPELSKHMPSALALLETARRRLLLNTKPSNPAPNSA